MKVVLGFAILFALGTSAVSRADDDMGTAAPAEVTPQAAPEPAPAPKAAPARTVEAGVGPQTRTTGGGMAAPMSETPKGRGKSLNFEDNVVEGMNGNPMDSLENISKKDAKDQSHLYRKRTDFRKEMKNTIQEGGFTP